MADPTRLDGRLAVVTGGAKGIGRAIAERLAAAGAAVESWDLEPGEPGLDGFRRLDVADRAAVMYLGEIVETANVRELFASPARPYSRALLAAVPRLDGGEFAAPGRGSAFDEIPSPLAPPRGCRFHPRCPLAFDRCRSESPPALPVPTGAARCFLAAEGFAQDPG